MVNEKREQSLQGAILTPEQEELLDLYIQKLDSYYEELLQAEKTEVAIETLHLRRILSKKRS